MLANIRETMRQYINENPYTIIVNTRPTKDNGFGKQVPDISKPTVENTLGVARITRRRLPDPILTNARTPYDYLDSYYLLALYDATWLKQDLIFEYYGNKYKTLLIENRIIDGGIAYKLCNIEQVTSQDIGA